MPDKSDENKTSEFGLIARYFKPLARGEEGALGLLDDAALLDVPAGRQLVVTTDALVAGVHFLDTLSPEDVAHKVVGVNISDLAAMGAEPRAAFLAAQFPHDTGEEWIARFASGLGEALQLAGASLMGGDTVSTPGPMAFTLTALGYVETGRALKRSGARVGDDVYVTGTIGDGALGLLTLTGELPPDAHLAKRYARPEPRWALGHALAVRGLVNACADISDGLVADAGHIGEASGVELALEAARVPLSAAARAALETSPDLLKTILAGGDDYELVFTAPPVNAPAIAAQSQALSVAVTRIGTVRPGRGRAFALDENGQELDVGAGGYVHLQS